MPGWVGRTRKTHWPMNSRMSSGNVSKKKGTLHASKGRLRLPHKASSAPPDDTHTSKEVSFGALGECCKCGRCGENEWGGKETHCTSERAHAYAAIFSFSCDTTQQDCVMAQNSKTSQAVFGWERLRRNIEETSQIVSRKIYCYLARRNFATVLSWELTRGKLDVE